MDLIYDWDDTVASLPQINNSIKHSRARKAPPAPPELRAENQGAGALAHCYPICPFPSPGLCNFTSPCLRICFRGIVGSAPSSALTLLYPRRGESRGWGRVRCLFTRCERKKRPIKFILETKGKKTGVTEKGDGVGGGRAAGASEERLREGESGSSGAAAAAAKVSGCCRCGRWGWGRRRSRARARPGSSGAAGERGREAGAVPPALLSLGAAAAAAAAAVRGAGTRCGWSRGAWRSPEHFSCVKW
ncbi:uncharacterized protein LOC110256340 [Sus scrofa]|uniref:uncharacterized protein LOC110256340 n=1 Tax=Sus scrofa TaxID=9823 RepID=UPI000A2B056B|nr:uncharacterized protein LOC110256340 [Sus scrofa]